MNKIKALLFDNDGILVATEHLYYQATYETVKELGYELSEEEYAEYFLKNNTGIKAILDKLQVSKEKIDFYRDKRSNRYTQLVEEQNCLIEGVNSTIDRLNIDYRMAIVTSSRKNHFDAIHRSAGIINKFELVLTREDYNNSKPDPEPYLLAVKLMGLKKEECIVIEDSERGIQAAVNAGIKCIAIPYGLTVNSNFDGAWKILGSIYELPAALKEAEGL